MQDVTVVIVGAGFSGLCAGILLKKAGVDSFVILEKAERVGGTWRENTYPGAACDVQSHLYSYSFEPNPRWTRSYGSQPEILAYLDHCARKYCLAPHLRFGAEVTRADFDEPTGTWTVRTRAGDAFRARALILGNGALHIPAYPDIPGLERFAGARFHSAQWDHRYDLVGKRVAVVGTGASAIQFVPQIAPQAARLHLFQRTPPWVMPKPDRTMSARERRWMERIPALHWARRTGLYWWLEWRALGFCYEPRVLALAERIALRYLREAVPDRALRAKLTPTYRMGCKRVLLSNDYYPALQRPNVEVVTDAITEVTARGVRTADGAEREVDAIILGTGFRVVDYLASIEIRGRDGRELNETWRAQLRTYLGINVAGFPNLHLLMGPNTGLGHNSMIFMIEAQARYAVQSIVTLLEKDLAFLDVRPAVQDAFHAELQQKLGKTVWASGCTSWYKTPDGGIVLWPGFTVEYWLRTRRLDLRAYEGQNVSRAPTRPDSGA